MRLRKNNKRMGQHFLKSYSLISKEVSLLSPVGKVVLEIGAGDGRVSEEILRRNPKKLILVEKDKSLISLLNEKFSGFENVEIIEEDFLKIEPLNIDCILGNIPYYISSKIIFKLNDFSFQRAVLMIQHEFALRMIAKPNSPHYGRLSLTSQYLYNITYVQKVPASFFIPRPKVDSALVLLEKKNKVMPSDLLSLITYLFQHKNKKVRNALMDADFEKDAVEQLGEIANKRVRTLSISDVERILQQLNKIKRF